jgi:nucleotide-binding universal stress UspA family protein
MTFAPKRLLVPVDVDPIADRALADRLVDAAADLAKALGADMTLLHVALPVYTPIEPPADLVNQTYRAMLDVAEARNTMSSRVLKELEARAKALGATARVLVTTRSGSVPHVINDIAKEERCDLIVMTTHARRGVQRVLLGSVAERTAHLAHVPVLLLPPS